MVPSDWWKTFFEGAPVELWQRAAGPAMTAPEVAFLEEKLRPPSGGSLLDVACGGGRHAVALAQRGYRLTGVDYSNGFLAAARTAADAAGVTVDWRQMPMQDIDWKDAFDGAYCLGNSLGYLEDAETVRFVQGVARALRPGCRFVLDTGAVAESLLPNLKIANWYDFGDLLFLVRNQYDPVQGRLETEYTHIKDGKLDRKWGFQQVYTYRQLCQILEEAGFRDCLGFQDTQSKPYALGAPRLLLVAARA